MKIGGAVSFLAWSVVLGLLGLVFYHMHEAQQTERRQRESLARLMSSERVAAFVVKKVTRDPKSGTQKTVLWWQEERGDRKLPVRAFTIHGDQIYFDTVQVTFDPQFAKKGDPLRGHSMTLFRRIYALEETKGGGLRVPPGGVVNLDLPQAVARALGQEGRQVVGERSVPDFYKSPDPKLQEMNEKIWSEIWELFTDPRRIKAEQVKSAQRKAVGKPLVEGMEYILKLSPTGQLDLLGPAKPRSPIKP